MLSRAFANTFLHGQDPELNSQRMLDAAQRRLTSTLRIVLAGRLGAKPVKSEPAP